MGGSTRSVIRLKLSHFLCVNFVDMVLELVSLFCKLN